MIRVPFWKLQSVGNDFPLVHLAELPALFGSTEAPVDLEQILPKLAVEICDRHYGVGGDGLLAAGMEGDAVRLRMFNPDGTEDFCGNGIRCAAVHAHAQGWVGSDFVIRHLDREIEVHLENGQVRTVLGSATYDPERVPHTRFGEIFNANVWTGMDAGQPLSLFGSALTTGSTHVVIPTISLPDDDTFAAVSAKIEVDPLYPKRTSVIWVQEVEPNALSIRIWERGVGETFGCGTGASAAAADYMRRKARAGAVQVQSRGGTLEVTATAWHKPLSVVGSADMVFQGTFGVR